MRMGTEFAFLPVFLQSQPDLAADEETTPNLGDYRRDLGMGFGRELAPIPDVEMQAVRAVLRSPNYSYSDQNRIGDHICYIFELTKVRICPAIGCGLVVRGVTVPVPKVELMVPKIQNPHG